MIEDWLEEHRFNSTLDQLEGHSYHDEKAGR